MKSAAKKLVATVLLSTFLIVLSLTSLASVPKAHAQGNPLTRAFCDAISTDAAAVASNLFPGGIANFMSLITANNAWYEQSFCQFYSKVFDTTNTNEIFGERYTHAQVNWIINSLASFVLNTAFGMFTGDGTIYEWFLNFLLADAGTEFFAQVAPPKGAVGFMTTTMGLMQSTQPSFLFHSLPNFLQKFSLATPAQAQGYGYNALSAGGAQSLQSLWAAFRNMSYFLMVLLLVVSGFMIMFRVRMGQTAVTLQLMIPKIIMTLIGITFSFAISGFIIDLVYLTLGFVLFLIQTSPGTFVTDAAQLLQDISGTWGFFRLWSYIQSSFGIISVVLGLIIPLGILIIPVLVVILLFKVWWAMLKAYAHLLIHIITGPFQILLGLLPGQSMGFGQWLRNVFGYAAVFVVVPLVFVFIMILWGTGVAFSASDWDPLTPNPPLLGGQHPPINGLAIENLPSLPLFSSGGSMGGAVLQFGIGLIMISLLPSIIDKVPAAFKAANFGKADITGDLIAAGVLAGQARSAGASAMRGAGLPTTIPGMVGGAYNAGRAGVNWARSRGGGGGPGPTAPTGTTPPIPPPPSPE